MNAGVPSAWRTRRISAAGLTLAAFEAGSASSDAPVVLLLHGLGHWTDAAWGRLVPLLRAERRYVGFDLPGFGASDKPDVRYDRAFFNRIVSDAAVQLAPSRFAVVGHSLGGYIAADWAGAHPERVSHLALIAPAAFARTPRFVLYGLIARLFGRAFLGVAPSRRFVDRVLRRAVVDPRAIDPAHLEQMYALAQDRAYRRAFRGVYSAALGTFVRRARLQAGFARYAGPVFCAWGRGDRFISARGLRDVKRIYSHAETLVLERSGHLPSLEEPEILAAALDAFLSR